MLRGYYSNVIIIIFEILAYMYVYEGNYVCVYG